MLSLNAYTQAFHVLHVGSDFWLKLKLPDTLTISTGIFAKIEKRKKARFKNFVTGCTPPRWVKKFIF